MDTLFYTGIFFISSYTFFTIFYNSKDNIQTNDAEINQIETKYEYDNHEYDEYEYENDEYDEEFTIGMPID